MEVRYETEAIFHEDHHSVFVGMFGQDNHQQQQKSHLIRIYIWKKK
jgi:hypothetical protein